MFRILLAACVACLPFSSATARPFKAVSLLKVYPLSADTFEVVEEWGRGPRGMWCAAGDYVRAIGRDKPGQRIYIARARGPSPTIPGRISVTFTLRPPANLPDLDKIYYLTVKEEGRSLSAMKAHYYCNDFERLFWPDF